METDQTVEPVLQMLREKGFRITPQRRAILAEVMRTKDHHINATGLAGTIDKRVPGVNPSTVYRTLALLDELGVLTHAHFEAGVEYHRSPEAGHVHLTCSSCGKNKSLSRSATKSLEGIIHRRHGFSADLTHFAISGLCEKCLRRRRA